ncbi:glycosyltransferase family 4 protein [Zunongwangia sp. H14]|uniref:glycosyltransferase family 4 protein n=1 Tax=Zunongwangia sp. H14 TaxID=3240792 RepID=UPI0035666E25
MRFTIFSHVEHLKSGDEYFAYEPYVREMNIWLKYVDEVEIVAPLKLKKKPKIEISYQHSSLHFTRVALINFLSLPNAFISFLKLPLLCFKIFKAMSRADHIHIRCPGNIGLLACMVQVFFPKKPKTAKYAGNWDPNAKQPRSYKFQKWILNNTFLTRNIQVLVYGTWAGQSANIVSFFTASFSETEKKDFKKDFSVPHKFVFVGTLSEGKRPLFASRIIQELYNTGKQVELDIYGDGVLKESLAQYIASGKLARVVKLHGNRPLNEIKEAYQKSHFIILPSRSEGWPKALAEGMFYGCIPIATPVSCIPWMLDYGKRGILIGEELKSAVSIVKSHIESKEKLKSVSAAARIWSQEYTLEKFETEIKRILET